MALKRASKSKPQAQDMPMDVRMLEMLACPLTKGPLVWDGARSELVSRTAKLAYPVRDGIPVMLPSEARPVDDD
jgi:uncharacterized protein YbaR (Trm112 family)